MGENLEVICLPAFILQFERLMIGLVCKALRCRVERQMMAGDRSTLLKKVRGIFTDAKERLEDLLRNKVDIKWGSEDRWGSESFSSSSDRINGAMLAKVVNAPVCMEELYAALVMMKPRLLDKHHVVNNELRQLIRNCKNLVPDLEQVAQLFEQDTFMRRALHSGNYKGEGKDEEGSPIESEFDDLWDRQTSCIHKEEGASSGVADERSEGVNDKEQEPLVMTADTFLPTEDSILPPERHIQGLDTGVLPAKAHLQPWTFQADNLVFQTGEDVREVHGNQGSPQANRDAAFGCRARYCCDSYTTQEDKEPANPTRYADFGYVRGADLGGNDVPDRAHRSL